MAYRETVLVTGAAGGVGTHVVKVLLDQGFQVKATDLPGKEFQFGGSRVQIVTGDLVDPSFLADLPLGVDHVIHAAAVVDSFLPWPRIQAINVDAAVTLYQRCAAVGIERFIFLSSGSIYRGGPDPLTEDAPQEPYGQYERSKFLAEKGLLRARRKGNDTELVTLRPAWVIGPYSTALMAAVATVPPLYKHYLGFALKAKGGPRSNMVHALDVARAAVYFLAHGEDTGIYNIACDDVLTFADYFNIACREYGLAVLPLPIRLPPNGLLKALRPVGTLPAPVQLLNGAGERLWQSILQRYNLVEALHPRLDVAALDHAFEDLILDGSAARERGFEPLFPDYASAIRDVLERYRRARWIF